MNRSGVVVPLWAIDHHEPHITTEKGISAVPLVGVITSLLASGPIP
jgi:hypothetical protein